MTAHFSMAYLMFADVKGYSDLSDLQLQIFCGTVVPKIFAVLQDKSPFYVNSWGDAFVAAFDDPVNATECSLELRAFVRDRNWNDDGLPESLAIRISLHSGRVVRFEDPITKGTNVYGREVSRAARIEPVVPPNEIFTTNLMIKTLDALPKRPKCDWDPLGRHPLAKAWGAEELYRLRRPSEPVKTIADLELPEIANVFRIPKENSKRDDRMMEILSETSVSYSLLGLSGFNYVHSQGKNWNFGIKRHLEDGRPMRLLLAHPEGDEAKIRKRAEARQNAGAFLKVPLSRLEELQSRYPNLEVRLATLSIYCSLFFTDRSVLYDPYHLGYSAGDESGQNLFVVIEFTKGQCYQLLLSHFEFLWNDPSTATLLEVIGRFPKKGDGGK